MTTRTRRRIMASLLLLIALSGCGPNYVMLHSRTGEPLAIYRSAYTKWGCEDSVKKEALRIGFQLRSIEVKGRFFGDEPEPLWPFQKGYVCVGTKHELRPLIVDSPA